ncbi:MAG TPA: dienelactone hydrolase family protein [Stellaceae bacterium]|jgi:dienelactone hydrolase|nr:dienelactone hydrolase family protein [Stellaceae bacterium]
MKKLSLAAIVFAAALAPSAWTGSTAQAAVQVKTVDYQQGDTTLEGWLVYDGAKQGKRPGILVYPAYNGPTDTEKDVAERLAKMGYVAFVADVYGKGIRPADPKSAGAEMGKYMKDRGLLRQRAQAAFDQLSHNPMVDVNHLAAIGYCFGGAPALDLARSGAPLKITVSFHGVLTSPTPQDDNNIKGRVLALHGADDPIVGPQAQDDFKKEMTAAHVNWQLVLYGGAVHAFTEKTSGNDNSKGAAYNANADKLSWEAMTQAFKDSL